MKRLCLLTMLAFSCAANAELFTARQLVYSLNTEDEFNLAVFYIAGAQDSRTGVTICPPPDKKLRDSVVLVMAVAQSAPESAFEQTADEFVAMVLTTAWPCSQQPKKAPAARTS